MKKRGTISFFSPDEADYFIINLCFAEKTLMNDGKTECDFAAINFDEKE